MNKKLLEIVKDGKERIIGREGYINSAVLIAITNIHGKDYIILEKRALEIRQGGEISFPGGKFDKNDINTEVTAIRETTEELGISREKIEIIGKFGTLVNPSGMILDVYIGNISIQSLEDIRYNKAEVAKVLLIPIDFFIKTSPRVEKIGMENIPLFSTSELRLPERYGNSWTGRARDVYFYNFQDEVIWGITAEIIYEFMKKLRC